MNAEPTEFVLRIRARPGDVPTIIRLRRLLKCMLRSFGFVVESIRPADAQDKAAKAAA
jgi:hypothetical protein